MLEKREEVAWRELGWHTDLVRLGGIRITNLKVPIRAYRDFFGKYDLLAAWPQRGILVLVQVSAQPPGSHGRPLGFKPPMVDGESIAVETVMAGPVDRTSPVTPPGVYEVYAHWKKVKNRWQVNRKWWV
jgi:hypothetical protein